MLGPVQEFVDARGGTWEDQQHVVDRVEVGGMIVLDDFTPVDELTWDEDPVRDWWLGHPQLLTTEILGDKAEAVLLAVNVTATSPTNSRPGHACRIDPCRSTCARN
jgi:hypothetical protein